MSTRPDAVLASIRQLSTRDYHTLKSGLAKLDQERDAEMRGQIDRMKADFGHQLARMERLALQISVETAPATANAVPPVATQPVQAPKAKLVRAAKITKRIKARGAKTGVKYRSEDGKETWSGRGPKPGWLVNAMKTPGKTLESFKVA